jgi:hypothetical protein
MGEAGPPADSLPPTGFVVDGIVMGFLYKTDSRLTYLGCVVSDPASDKEARGRALDALLDALADEARGLGYVYLVGSPSIPSLTARMVRQGFVAVPATYAVRRL